MSDASHPATKERLIGAAAALFAARGFHATTARDIAARAGTNVAAGHYHYGSKKRLYVEVLRAQFAEVRAVLARRGAAPPASALARLSRRDLERLLHARVMAMLDMLVGPSPSLHGTLMQREMTDPSEAMPVIVDEFIRPTLREMVQIISRLEPRLDAHDTERCAYSLIGEVLFYHLSRPALLRMAEWQRYPRGFTKRTADHITAFCLGGMERLAANGRKGRHAR